MFEQKDYSNEYTIPDPRTGSHPKPRAPLFIPDTKNFDLLHQALVDERGLLNGDINEISSSRDSCIHGFSHVSRSLVIQDFINKNNASAISSLQQEIESLKKELSGLQTQTALQGSASTTLGARHGDYCGSFFGSCLRGVRRFLCGC